MKNKDVFLVNMYVKPYVCKYLRDNFHVANGKFPHIIDLRSDSLLYRDFLNGLQKTDLPVTQALPTQLRPCLVSIRITYDIFQRHGWELAPEAAQNINIMLEQRCKNILLTYISTLYCVTGNLARCIQIFYEKFGYNEDIWPVDSIRKIWQRDRNVPKETFYTDIIQKISDFILAKMSGNGTLTKQASRNYENNRIQF